jgi:hypothetical protein
VEDSQTTDQLVVAMAAAALDVGSIKTVALVQQTLAAAAAVEQ